MHFFGKIFRSKYTLPFFDFWSDVFFKKKRFLLIALALSILLHVLIFVFTPELKSEINSDSYLKRITKISIFKEEVKPETPKAEIKPELPKKRKPDRNVKISKSRNIDETTGAPKTAGELAVIPKAMNPRTPDYPESLEEEGVEGSVTLELLISKEGKILKAKVIKSDHELFSESALKAVKKYKFSPGKLADGSSADSIIEFVVKFEISL